MRKGKRCRQRGVINMSERMVLHRMENRAETGYTTWGSHWRKGTVLRDAVFSAENEEGRRIPLQSRITACWPDGSVKWAAHTGDSAGMGKQITTLAEPSSGSLQEPVNETEKIKLEELEDCIRIDAGSTRATVHKSGQILISDLVTDHRMTAKTAVLTMILEKREKKVEGKESSLLRREIPFSGEIKEVTVQEAGPLRAVIKAAGTHRNKEEEKLAFQLYMEFCYNSSEIKFTHTFFYDGDEKYDFLKGIGIQFAVPVEGAPYNRHIKFGIDHGVFHESPALLLSWRPRVPERIYQAQINGEFLRLTPERDSEALTAAGQIPIWGEYVLWQDSASHYSIRKRISDEDCCYVEGLHGNRAPGVMGFGGENGGILLGRKDCWQKYPSTMKVSSLDGDMAQASLWFWSPESEAMDFRHYAKEGYSQSYYEGFDFMGATPYGIANTNEFTLRGFPGEIPGDETIRNFACQVQKPPVYIASPEYYHELQAFGVWSLPRRDTPAENWLEDQLDRTVDFYKKEIEVRNWYGFFHYGDFMHTYDKTRHCWRYDMGGYAWQNTELVPTLWLWFAFLRSGREDIYTMAEAMSRHCSEVDTYHLGAYRGIGSRHNVRHWGCSCKEARIAMAGHHRFYHYLTGDYRLQDVFEDVKDGDFALLTVDPLGLFFDKEKMVYPTHARSGPDWSSFCSNWMTEWERTENRKYMDKIVTGIEDLKKTPFKLISGSDFEYNPEDSHLRYIGERATGGTHLQICMGAVQVWLELAQLLEDEEWTRMLADFGRFYYLPREKQQELTGGLLGEKVFTYPYMAAGIAAFGANYYKDHELGRQVWQVMKGCLKEEVGDGLFGITPLRDAGNQEVLYEMPRVSTNVLSQWSLNVIVALDLIREDLPTEFEEE